MTHGIILFISSAMMSVLMSAAPALSSCCQCVYRQNLYRKRRKHSSVSCGHF